MTTRRKFGLGGIAAIIAAQRAPAALVRSLIAARAAMTGGKKLPYDAEVEYLETHRWSYVDTGIVAKYGCKIYFEHYVENTHFSYGQFVFGDLTSTFFYGDNWNNLPPSYAGNKGPYGSVVHVGRHAIVMDATGYYLDGTLVSGWGASTVDSANSMLLGRSRESQYYGVRTFYGKIYSFGYDNPDGTAAQRLIPVLIGDEGAFYDKITDAVLRNLGEEPFIVGPVKARGASGQNGGYKWIIIASDSGPSWRHCAQSWRQLPSLWKEAA